MESLKKRVVDALAYMLHSADSMRYGDDNEFDFAIFRADLDETLDEIEEDLDD